MTKSESIQLLTRLGFRDWSEGATLKHSSRDTRVSVYWLPTADWVTFVGYSKQEQFYDARLWRRIAPRRGKDRDDRFISLEAVDGREEDALNSILA